MFPSFLTLGEGLKLKVPPVGPPELEWCVGEEEEVGGASGAGGEGEEWREGGDSWC